jgi:hypothetical protein
MPKSQRGQQIELVRFPIPCSSDQRGQSIFSHDIQRNNSNMTSSNSSRASTELRINCESVEPRLEEVLGFLGGPLATFLLKSHVMGLGLDSLKELLQAHTWTETPPSTVSRPRRQHWSFVLRISLVLIPSHPVTLRPVETLAKPGDSLDTSTTLHKGLEFACWCSLHSRGDRRQDCPNGNCCHDHDGKQKGQGVLEYGRTSSTHRSPRPRQVADGVLNRS